jgi:RimJ/RimL family protein N-acetyltransferase
VLQTPEENLASIEALSPADKAQVSPGWLARVRALTEADPWTHLASPWCIVPAPQGSGAVATRAPPNSDGIVEISYGIDPDHRGKGYATEAAEALVSYALGDPRVRVVRAHTSPEANASTRVLTKCGLRHLGEVTDPEDGLVWRWEKRRDEAAEPSAAADPARV